MHVVRAPEPLPEQIDLFIAGGISNCPDWQEQAAEYLSVIPGVAVNPRRVGDLAKDGDEARRQIEWEHEALNRSKTVLFWFPQETLCPITLLELGAAMQRPGQAISVGAHPNYQRRFDVVEQYRLQRPGQHVYESLEAVCNEYILLTRLFGHTSSN